ILKTLAMTNLLSQFETYESVEEAIVAAYLGSRYSRGKAGDARPRMLCVCESTDVGTFLREVLCSAGYNALTTGGRGRPPYTCKFHTCNSLTLNLFASRRTTGTRRRPRPRRSRAPECASGRCP